MAPVANAGVLGQPTTSVLFGGEDIDDDYRSGFEASFTIKRSDFGMNYMQGPTGLDVVTHGDFPRLDPRPVSRQSIDESTGGDHLTFERRSFDEATISDLPAAFRVEDGAIQDQIDLVSLGDQPLQDRALLHGVGQPGHRDLGQRGTSRCRGTWPGRLR